MTGRQTGPVAAALLGVVAMMSVISYQVVAPPRTEPAPVAAVAPPPQAKAAPRFEPTRQPAHPLGRPTDVTGPMTVLEVDAGGEPIAMQWTAVDDGIAAPTVDERIAEEEALEAASVASPRSSAPGDTVRVAF